MNAMKIKELALFVLNISKKSKEEFEKDLNALSPVDNENARDLLILLDTTKETSYDMGYQNGAQGFRDWLIARYPDIRKWALEDTDDE